VERVSKIIELLLKYTAPVSIDFIADKMNVSNKTIRNDFSKVEQIVTEAGLNLKKKPGVGIIIEGTEEKKLELIKNAKNSVSYVEPYSPEDRINYILKALFMSKTSVTMKELAYSLYVSRVTIQKDLESVEQWLSKYNLKLMKKPNYGMEIIGSEEDWRKAIACLITSYKGYDELKELLYDEYEGKIDYKSILKLKELLNIDYKLLEKIVTAAEAKLQFKFSDEAYACLIMHIAISIKRLKEGRYIKLSEEMLGNLKDNDEYEISQQIARDIEASFKVRLPESEVGYILLHILGTKLLGGKRDEINIDFQSQTENELAIIMAKEIISIAERALRINLYNDKQLLNGLILHLRPTINRLRYGLTLRNPILKEIKENYIEIYGAAWMTSTIFEKYIGVKIPEEEIGYICLHLAASVERNKNPLKALIVCASGIGTSQFIAARLERSFKEIEILDVISIIELKQRDLEGVDMVISTVPIEVNKPALMISPLLNHNDIRKIELFIESLI
jgi:transcriptional antiterminator